MLLQNATREALQLLERLAPYQRRINDVLFEFVDAKRFRELRALAAELVGLRRPRGGDARAPAARSGGRVSVSYFVRYDIAVADLGVP